MDAQPDAQFEALKKKPTKVSTSQCFKTHNELMSDHLQQVWDFKHDMAAAKAKAK